MYMCLCTCMHVVKSYWPFLSKSPFFLPFKQHKESFREVPPSPFSLCFLQIHSIIYSKFANKGCIQGCCSQPHKSPSSRSWAGGKGSAVGELFIKITSCKYVTAFGIWTRFCCLWTRFPILLRGNRGCWPSRIPCWASLNRICWDGRFWSEGLQPKEKRVGIGFLSEEHIWCNLPLWVAQIN